LIPSNSTGEFEVTTNTDENVYIQDGALVIKPTLQNETLLTAPYALLNLTAEGICTSRIWSDCVAVTNSTNSTILNPVKSGRVNTKIGASIKYGRVEVVAKLPVGDWLWPAIWMLPVANIYGDWPASGEIDIVESRGNNYTYAQGGNNVISSTLHWGPIQSLDQYWRTYEKNSLQHTTFADGFHTFGLEWSEKYLFTFVDTRLRQVLYSPFNALPWIRGHIPSYYGANSVNDPWSSTRRDSTPFDTKFYLILNVAVGGTNGFFADGSSGKPWFDGSANATSFFWNAKDQWYTTWKEGQAQMTVQSVKMWQQCNP
jgi:beta-glucanase (GH16 family)